MTDSRTWPDSCAFWREKRVCVTRGAEVCACFSSLNHALTLVIGLLVGLTDMGGGALMTPLLIVVLGVKLVTAVGTDLLYLLRSQSGSGCVSTCGRIP